MDGDKIVEDLLFLKVLLQVQRLRTCLRCMTLLFVKTIVDLTKCIGVHTHSGHSVSS